MRVIAIMDMLNRIARITALRYLVASIVALAADMGVFLALLALKMAPMPASALSYAMGIVVHWLISSRAVFVHAVRTGPERLRQKALFVASALVGLALTALIVGVATQIGMEPRLAKILATAASFVATWTLRNRIVFAPRVAV